MLCWYLDFGVSLWFLTTLKTHVPGLGTYVIQKSYLSVTSQLFYQLSEGTSTQICFYIYIRTMVHVFYVLMFQITSNYCIYLYHYWSSNRCFHMLPGSSPHHPSHHTPQPTNNKKTHTTVVLPPSNRNTMTPAALWPLVSWLDVDVVMGSSGNGRLEATTAHLSSDFHCRAEMTVPFSVSWKGEELKEKAWWEERLIGAAHWKTHD